MIFTGNASHQKGWITSILYWHWHYPELSTQSLWIYIVIDLEFKELILGDGNTSIGQRKDCVYHQLRLVLLHNNAIRSIKPSGYVWGLMDLVVDGLAWKTCLVYLDDIMVMGLTFEEHLRNLHEVFNTHLQRRNFHDVFSRFRTANLKLNLKKCALFHKKVETLDIRFQCTGYRY